MWTTDGARTEITRRWFLRATAATVGGLVCLPGCGEKETSVTRTGAARAGGLGFILGAGRDRNNATGEERYHLAFVDLDADPPRAMRAPIGFFGHGLVPHPVQRERLAVFEKRGRGACEFDLAKGRVVRTIETAPSRQFYGHGAFSRGGESCFATESDVEDDYRGVIAVRDAKTMEILSEFPSFGSAPHDCVLVDDGRTMVITNGGDRRGGDSAPSVTFVDVDKRRLVDKIEFDSPSINAGHVTVASNGDLAVVSAPREGETGLGALTLRPVGEEPSTMTEPADVVARMEHETLSVAIHEPSATVGATNPAGDVVTFWSMRTRGWLGTFEVGYPRGIVLTEDGDEFIVSHGKTETLLTRISVKTLEPVADATPIACGISGSHLINYRHDA